MAKDSVHFKWGQQPKAFEHADEMPESTKLDKGFLFCEITLKWQQKAKSPFKEMLIVVEGCVGTGKSTVARGLAAFRNSKTIFEHFETNPFLAAFYEDPKGNALETEFAFLLLHYHQLKNEARRISAQEVIADFHLDKDLLYADCNLQENEMLVEFRRLHSFLAAKIPIPNILICLSAPTDLVIERIRSRKRDYELKIDTDYYSRINLAYEQFFAHYPGRKLRISMQEWDFVKDPSLYGKLSSMLDEGLATK